MQFWEPLEIWCKTLRFEGSGNRPPSFSLLDWVKKSAFFVFCWIILHRNIGYFHFIGRFSLYIIIRLGSQGSSKVGFIEIITPSESDGKLDFHTHTEVACVLSPQLVLLYNAWVDSQLYSSLCHVFPSDAKERNSRYGII